VENSANELAEYLRQLENNWQILGATPATIAKVANRYRWQILLKLTIFVFPIWFLGGGFPPPPHLPNAK
ncbi:MAG: hypothetical protein ACK6CG_07765, partial [Pseudanabaena sp.]